MKYVRAVLDFAGQFTLFMGAAGIALLIIALVVRLALGVFGG